MERHSEVINLIPSVLIVGNGWVGSAVKRTFPSADVVDINGMISGEMKEHYDFCFICVPTPCIIDLGKLYMGIVQEVLVKYRDLVSIFVLKSTPNIGFCDVQKSRGFRLVFEPEYLGETVEHPNSNGTDFVILGGSPEDTSEVAGLHSLVRHSRVRIHQCTAIEAEITKLMENSFFYTKVMFCNQMFDICKHLGVDYNKVRELWLEDTRVSRDHTFVYPDNRGVGGKCLPKDMTALCSVHADTSFLESVVAYNNKIRSVDNAKT